MAFDRGPAGSWRHDTTGDEVTGDVDVRRVHEHLDADASGPGSRAGSWRQGGLVYDVDSDVTSPVVTGCEVWAYDLGANTWTMRGSAPDRPVVLARGVLGLRPGHGPGRRGGGGIPAPPESKVPSAALWTYDVDSDTWTPIGASRLARHLLGARRALRLRRLGGQVDRVRSRHPSPDRRRTRRGSSTSARAPGRGPARQARPSWNYWGFDCRYTPGEPSLRRGARRGRSYTATRPLAAYDATADRWDTLNGSTLGWARRPGSAARWRTTR